MDAARYYGIGDVRYEQIEKPSCKKGEKLIHVLYSGICGSDLHIYKKGMFIQNIPETMGHEFVGVLEKNGQAVIADPMVPCMRCRSCQAGKYNTCENLGFIGEVQQGCYAEYIALPENKIIPLPVQGEKNAEELKKYVLAEPLAVAVNVMHRACFDTEDKLLVMGAGPIGCLVIALAKQICGVKSITAFDLSQERLEYAKKAGADEIFNDSSALNWDYTVSIDCAGVAQTVQLAQEHLTASGRLCIVSIFEKPAVVDCNNIVSKQLTIVGCNVYCHDDLVTACELIAGDKLHIEFLITHSFLLRDCKDAFKLLTSGTKTAQKVIFNMTGNGE